MLTPEQIGRIAGHIKIAIDLNTNLPPEDNPLCMTAPDNFMEPWERCLESLICQDPNLTSYLDIRNDPALDFLVEYYGN